MTNHAKHAAQRRSVAPPARLPAENVESPIQRDSTLSGDSAALADEAAALTIIVHALRALRPELDRAASIDALNTPASYRAMLAMFDALIGDAEGMLDTREWHDVDRGTAA